MSKFIRTANDKIIDFDEVLRVYITKMDNDKYEPSRQFMYCVDVDFKKKGSLTLAAFRDKDYDNKAHEKALEYMDELYKRLI